MPSKFKVEIRAQLTRNGRVVKTLPWRRTNSLLKQFMQILLVQLQQANVSVLDYQNTSRSVTANATNLSVNAAAGATTKGTVIGTGTNAVTMTDYKLQTQVTTNITHGIVTFALENPDAATWRASITRIFTNNTGASLGIREVALYANAADGGTQSYCIDRSLYSVDVPNGVAITLTYRITVTL